MMIARHRAQLPAADLDRLRAMADRLRPAAQGLSGRNRSRLRQLEDPRRLDALLTLPARILERVRRAGAPGIQLARELQNAVAIELLICIPMRLRNLRELRVGIHLHRGPGGRMWLTIPGEEVKNGVPLEGELPADSARLVALYLDRYRPLLASAGGDWLFPGAGAGAPKSDDGLRSSIAKAIATDCGLRFNPHLFRHTAAWLILRDNPAAHGQVQRVLGHKSLGSTMAFYSGLEGPAALQAYDRLIAGHREAPGPAGPRGRRPRRAS